MSAAMTPDLNRIVLVDPSDFTTPYDLALAGAMQAEGRYVRLVGQAGELSHTQRLHHGQGLTAVPAPAKPAYVGGR